MPTALSPNTERLQREADHTHLVLRLKMGRDMLPLPIYLHGVNRVYFTYFTLFNKIYMFM